MGDGGVMPVKTYVVRWRHRTLDTPGHPYRGSGYAYGRTRRRAVNDFFCPAFYPMGDRSGLDERRDAFRQGEIEIVEMRRA